jgi:hypothetical protein
MTRSSAMFLFLDSIEITKKRRFSPKHDWNVKKTREKATVLLKNLRPLSRQKFDPWRIDTVPFSIRVLYHVLR